MMSKRFLLIMSGLLLVFIVTILIDSILPVDADDPVESDLIVLLGGGDQGRVKKAAELYKEGYADQVLITPVGGNRTASETKTIAEHYGIPRDAMIMEKDSTSTYTNAVQTTEFMEEKDMESALVVTSDYHVKRAEFIFDKVNHDNLEFKYIAAPNLQGENWKERENSSMYWFEEFKKMWGYRMGLYKWIDQ
ncbi:YdcF family protein [Salinicoccus sp. HZC-1]|uniref:YdcF family protein n=1 Tax=Salinicoccus sp. HZC-1 TaxID=3385497 RepID=UPI00398AED5C